MPFDRLNHLDLCSGIGGFALGFEWAELSNPIGFCDIDKWCRQILAKHWPDVPVYDDVKEIANGPERFIQQPIDILTAGYPCQPFSLAGKRKGEEDDRHIWPHIFRIVTQQRPTWCVFENVYGHISMGLDNVLLDLEAEGYATRTFVVPACGIKALHKRDRVWIVSYLGDSEHIGSSTTQGSRRLFNESEESKEQKEIGQSERASSASSNVAYSDNPGIRTSQCSTNENGKEIIKERKDKSQFKSSGPGTNVAYSQGNQEDGELRTTQPKHDKGDTWLESECSNNRQPGRTTSQDVADTIGKRGCSRNSERQYAKDVRQSSRYSWHDREGMEIWDLEPNVGRVADGVPKRVDRLKGLGNAIVPQIAMQIGLAIKSTYK